MPPKTRQAAKGKETKASANTRARAEKRKRAGDADDAAQDDDFDEFVDDDSPAGPSARARAKAPAKKKAKTEKKPAADLKHINIVEETPPTDVELGEEEGRALAVATGSRRCQYNGKNAKLTMKLLVLRDPAEDLTCRLQYIARLRLNYIDNQDDPDTDVAGHILSYRIFKPTANRLKDDEMSWVEEILKTKDVYKTTYTEAGMCLQALYTETGEVREENVANEGHREGLKNDSLMFLEMLYIRPRFQGNGLMRPAMELYHTLLSDGSLPETYNFQGTEVLMPSKPNDNKGGQYKGINPDNVEEDLTARYNKRHYELYGSNMEVRRNPKGKRPAGQTTVVSVMGRPVPLWMEATRAYNPGAGGGDPETELSFAEGQRIRIVKRAPEWRGSWNGMIVDDEGNAQQGSFPGDFCRVVD